MTTPDPKANTTTEAYLAYKAGYLEESELKPVLYEPYLHFDAWLAYWAGLTNEYPLDKNGDPEMLTDEEALVAYLSGVTDTYPEDIKDPYDVRIVGYLKHLASIRWPEPDYPVNNEEFYLSTMEPTHTSNSEPSADIELDTVEGKVLSVEAYGDTYQQTYSGKNLLDIPDGYTGTSGGVTTTWSNNIATSNASSTTSTTCTLTSTLAFKSTTIPAGTYTFSVQSSTSQYYPILRLRDTSDTWHNYSITAGENSVTITTDYSANAAQLSLGLWTAGTSITNFVTEYPMLEVGSSATSYEPYTGGAPSPSPDYPQTIDVVTGEQTVTVTGKNLINFNPETRSNGGIDYIITNDTIVGTGVTTGTNSVASSNYYFSTPLSAGTYTFSIPQALSVQIFLSVIDDNSGFHNFIILPGNTSVTVTTNYTMERYRLAFTGWTAGDNVSISLPNKLQLEAGSSATPYEAFQSTTKTIDLGSTELAKIGTYQDYIYKSGDDWYIHKETGKTIVTGDSSEAWIAQTTNIGYMYRITLADVGSVPAGDKANLVSDYFTPTTSGVIYNVTSGGYIAQLTTPGYIRFNIGDTTNKLSEFRTWLGTHNTTVYYALATPTDTKITDSTLIGQLDALAGADTYDGKTYIKVTATNPNLPALLKVEAYKY